jgi:hypothetical protein
MYKLRIAIVVSILLALVAAATASAAGAFYCSEAKSSGGNGTFNNPWGCSTENQFQNEVVHTVCTVYHGGDIYRVRLGGYTWYRYSWVDGQCRLINQQDFRGYPPNTGVNFPMPMIIGLAVAAAAVLIVAGVYLRRRSTAH